MTAGSRTGETAEIRRFLDSLIFIPNTIQSNGVNVKNFSSLPITEPQVEMALEKEKKKNQNKTVSPISTPPPTSPITENDKSKNLIVLRKPIPSYTDFARMNGVKGTFVLKTTFSQIGSISNIKVLRMLPGGLLRQVIFAALRIKFLPSEKDGKPETIVKTVEYSFDIY